MATEKIILYDADRDIAVEANVSPAEAKRARADQYFATELLRTLVNQDPHKASTSTSHVEHEDAEFYNEEFLESNDEEVLGSEDAGELNSETQESEGGASSYRWSSPAVLLLLETYRSMEQILNSGKMSHKQVWKKISEKLTKNGHNVTGPQCYSKLRSLKKTYKSTKDHNNKSGNDRKTWKFYEIMDEIFGKKAWCDPVAVASSTGLSSKKTESNDSAVGSDSGCSSKSNKPSVTTLLGKRLKQKEEHEENRKKRHRERMEMDEKFLKVLEKLAEK
ncbi:uncharacterized protein LOC113371443 [Ctenocephalides felis]|uniref:uncharacterized protein LOC113365333 n=1 Tax=Ctenocephalides felis TaxID=7515 RepID=UPI000E6E58EB|nr:uncharacterized protein LOC113365333 [Ctenocephalides felis]XP_026467855.1 uncharacterized protein LOC113371443 [Ctenocephalides felis]